ncbi:hypothetical protein C4K20_3079 [Pseudomonas chlororaphis subsp. aurantiaca]|nr:hypothetical protein C4K20_3079 [Pseudomonas chlororaphis subsp. aurantiaca]AZD79684.1 hypothetical protein C4K15_3117 [Pseudomonas chlororaphis subsp. aurantiaca]
MNSTRPPFIIRRLALLFILRQAITLLPVGTIALDATNR